MQTASENGVKGGKTREQLNACPTGACSLVSGWRGALLWMLVAGLLVYIQWPMLKGAYYKSNGAEAPASAIDWRQDFPSALAEASQSGKPVLVDFTASWCPPCQVMKHEVWPDDQVADAMNERYIPVLVDVDRTDNKAVAQRYGITSIPTIEVVDEDGRVLRQGAFMSRSQMLEFLRKT
jgi:protein disulfide-isomerase